MFREFRRITVIKIRKPQEKDLNKDLQWFSESLGLFGGRDKEKSCFRIFIELVKAARRRKALSSDEIAERANLSRGTIVHHLHRLVESGLILSYDNKYILRDDNLEELVKEVKRDLLKVFKNLEIMAEELDDELGLLKREDKDTRVFDI